RGDLRDGDLLRLLEFVPLLAGDFGVVIEENITSLPALLAAVAAAGLGHLQLEHLLVPEFAGVARVKFILSIEQITALRPAQVLLDFFQVAVFVGLCALLAPVFGGAAVTAYR